MKWINRRYYRRKRREERRKPKSWEFCREWHPWYAWRPVPIPEREVGGLIIPAHYVWLECVNRRALSYRYTFFLNNMKPTDWEFQTLEKADGA